MTVDTSPATRDLIASATVQPVVGAVRVGLPHDVLLEFVTGLAYQVIEDPTLLEKLVELGDAAHHLEDHDLQQELGDDVLQSRLYDAQAPFRDLAASWDVPLSAVRQLGTALLNAWHDAGGQWSGVVVVPGVSE